MKRTMTVAGALACLVSPAAAHQPPEHVSARNFGPSDPAPGLVSRPVRYGADGHRMIGLSVPRQGRPVPIVVVLTGPDIARGFDAVGDAWLAPMLYDAGFAIARVETRPRRLAGVAGMIDDMADALAYLSSHAAELGIDPARIILYGIGPGAHAAALLGTDTARLQARGLAPGAIRGVVAVNGDGYRLAQQLADGGYRTERLRAEFGVDATTIAQLDPAGHAGSPNAGRFLFMASAGRVDFTGEARAMAALLTRDGARADMWEVPRTMPGASATFLGRSQNPQTAALRALFLEMAGPPAGGP